MFKGILIIGLLSYSCFADITAKESGKADATEKVSKSYIVETGTKTKAISSSIADFETTATKEGIATGIKLKSESK